MDQDSQINIIEGQIRECYGRVAWSFKTQEKCADILNSRNNNIKITQIILSALTTTGILFAIFGDNMIVGSIAAILSVCLFGINTYTKDYDLGEIAQKHSNAANYLWNIREKYLSLLTDLHAGTMNIESILVSVAAEKSPITAD